MSEQPTADELARIRARVEAITPGEWTYHQFKEKVYADNKEVCDVGEEWETDADGFFIAAAPADIRTLLTALEASESALAQARAALKPFAAIGAILTKRSIHPDYMDNDREIYSLNEAVLTRKDFVEAAEALAARPQEEGRNPMTQPADPTARIRERLGAIPEGEYRVLPPEPNRHWLSICHTVPGNTPEDQCFIIAEVSSIKIQRPHGIDDNAAFAQLAAAAPDMIRFLLAENERLFAGVEAAYKWLDENCNDIPLTGIDVWRLLKPLLEAARASHESGVTE